MPDQPRKLDKFIIDPRTGKPYADRKKHDGSSAASMALSFDPDQPRDEAGKWTSGGGGASNRSALPNPPEPEE